MSYEREIPMCRVCGAELTFVRTPNGKMMPCEHRPHWVLPSGDGLTYYTPQGDRIKGRTVDSQMKGTVIGYLPHWGSCNKPGQVRRRKPDELTERIRAQVAKEKADAQRRAERRQEKEKAERELREAMEAQMSLFRVGT